MFLFEENCSYADEYATILLNGIGYIDIPDDSSITMPRIAVETREGVVLKYQPNIA